MTLIHRLARALGAPALALAVGVLATGSAHSVGAERMVSEIQLNLSGIESMIRIQPERAREQIDQQKRMLELLEQQRPDHPMLEELKARVDELDGHAREAAAAEEEAVPTDDIVGEVLPPEVAQGLSEIEQLVAEAEGLGFQGAHGRMAERVEMADERLESLTEEHGDQIPPAHAPLIVLQERIGMLKEQLRNE